MDFAEHYPDTSSSVALACRSGTFEALEELIRQGKSVESVDNRGWRPIHEAACWNHSDCIKLLVKNGGAQLNSYTFEGQTPLWIASHYNSVRSVQALLEAGASVNLPNNEDVTPLHCAASKGHIEVVALLLENGSNVNLTDYGLYTPLHEAVIEGHEKIVELLLEHEADKFFQDSHGRTPLFCAFEAHKCAIVRLLGCDCSPSYIDLRASDGATALMLSAQSGCLDCTQFLIERGANANAKANDGVMAVHLALTANHQTVLEYLLDVTDHLLISKCCNPHADLAYTEGQHENSWSGNRQESVNIFTLAVTYERFECIRVLLKKGLRADEFPCLWRYRNRPVLTVLGLEYPFATPLSFLLSYSPFNGQILDIAKDLIDKGCKTNAYGLLFVPPLVAILFAPGWGNLDESNLLLDALNFLLNETDGTSIEELSSYLAVALVHAPKVFMLILQRGYLFDEKSFFSSLNMLSAFSENYFKFIAEFSSTGFLPLTIPEILLLKREAVVPTLKQLSRTSVRSWLWKANCKNLVFKATQLPLPASLISYLCYDDMTL